MEIEHASFTSLVLAASGGLDKEAMRFHKNLASTLAEKWDPTYSQTMNRLRCTSSHGLLHSAIQCIRGSHCYRGRAINTRFSMVDLIMAGSNIHSC